jgi:hypothetical protein
VRLLVMMMPFKDISHCEWINVKNHFGGLRGKGLICKTKLKKTGISKTLGKKSSSYITKTYVFGNILKNTKKDLI